MEVGKRFYSRSLGATWQGSRRTGSHRLRCPCPRYGWLCLLCFVSADAFTGNDGKAGCAAINIDPSIPQSSYPQFFRELSGYIQSSMPKYAAPVFLRVLRETNAMHNNKQNKSPLKKDGFDLDKIYGQGVDVEQAKESGKDVMMWWPGGVGHGGKASEDTYVTFGRKDWELIQGSSVSARL